MPTHAHTYTFLLKYAAQIVKVPETSAPEKRKLTVNSSIRINSLRYFFLEVAVTHHP